eukprot:1855279-Rhodomonas_salina.4
MPGTDILYDPGTAYDPTDLAYAATRACSSSPLSSCTLSAETGRLGTTPPIILCACYEFPLSSYSKRTYHPMRLLCIPSIILRACCPMSTTDIRYAAAAPISSYALAMQCPCMPLPDGRRLGQLPYLPTRLLCDVQYRPSVCCRSCYAVSSTVPAYGTVCLRACYAMSGTGVAMRTCCAVSSTDLACGVICLRAVRY